MKKILIPLLVLVLSQAAVHAVHAQGVYMATGLEIVDLGKDLDDVSTGFGLALDLGLDFYNGLALNLGLGASVHQEDGFDTDYTRISIGPRVIFDLGGTQPYLEAGYMNHNVSWDFLDYDIDGDSLYMAGGVLVPMASGARLGGYIKYSDWDGEDSFGNYGNVSTTIFGFSYLFVF